MALSRFVSVSVTEQPVVQEVASFSDCLHLAQIPAGTMPERFLSFASIEEVTDAGLPTRVLAAATTFFGQSPNPGTLIIGRQVPGVAKVVTVTITTEDDGTWSFDLNGTTIAFIAATNTEQEIAEGLANYASEYADEYDLTVSTPVGGVFTITANVAGDDFTVSALTVPGAGVGSATTTTANVAAEDATDALDAIVDAGAVFYGLTIQSRTEVVIDDVAAWASARTVMFFAQTSDAEIPAGTPGNMALELQALSYDTTDLSWHKDSTEFMDVARMARTLAKNFDNANATTAFQNGLAGVEADAGKGVVAPLTSAEITNVQTACNSYTKENGISTVFPGKVVSGKYTDTVITRHWLKARLEEAVFGALVGAENGISYDAAGATIVLNVITGVCQRAANAKHITPAFTVVVPDPAELTAAQRASRELPNCKVTANFNGFIHTVEVPVFLQY